MPETTSSRPSNELNQAEYDKGGHSENAVGLVQQAINQVNQGIVAGGGTP